MSDTLTPTVVSFHGQEIPTLLVNDTPFVAMRPIVENIGLTWPSQQTKFAESPDRWAVKDIVTVAPDGCQREMLCIPLRKLNGWLFSVNPEKVRPDLRDLLIAYQEECCLALHDYWTGKRRVYSPDLQNRLWYKWKPVLTTQQLAAALRATDVVVRGRKRANPQYFRPDKEYFDLGPADTAELRDQAAAVFACPISPSATELCVWPQEGARAMAMVLGGNGRRALYAQLERSYYADKSETHKPGRSLADALIIAERMLIEVKGQVNSLGQIKGLLQA